VKKVITNFILDILLFANLMSQAFTGILLHRIKAAPAGTTVLGLTGDTWGSLHWAFSILFVVIIVAHLVLHWDWVRATSRKYCRMTSRVLLACVVLFSVVILLTPFYLTRDFSDSRTTGKASIGPYPVEAPTSPDVTGNNTITFSEGLDSDVTS
jgi:hypothetical protein